MIYRLLIFLAAFAVIGCAAQKCNQKDDIASLTAAQNDDDRIKAAENLKHCASTPEVNTPLLAMLDDSNPKVRKAAVCSLMEINKDAPPAGILNKLAKEDAQSRTEIVDALSLISTPKSAQLLIYVAVFDPADSVRAAAAKSLGRCCVFSPGFVTYFASQYPYGYYDGIRDGAMYWPDLGAVVEVIPASPGKLQTTASKAMLYVLAKDKSEDVRAAAAYSLGYAQPSDEIINALAKALAGDASYKVKAECALSLGRSGDEKVRPVLLKATESDNDLLRMKATEALSELERGAYN